MVWDSKKYSDSADEVEEMTRIAEYYGPVEKLDMRTLSNDPTVVLNRLTDKTIIIRYIVYWSLVIMIIFSLDLTGKEFIYFQF